MPSPKNISHRVTVHTQSADFVPIFVPERCCVVSVFKVNRHISDRFSCHFLGLCEERIEPKRKSTSRSEVGFLEN